MEDYGLCAVCFLAPNDVWQREVDDEICYSQNLRRPSFWRMIDIRLMKSRYVMYMLVRNLSSLANYSYTARY